MIIWKRAKGRIVLLASGTAHRDQLIFALLSALRTMEKVIETVQPPFVIRILISGKVEMIRPDDLNLDFLSD